MRKSIYISVLLLVLFACKESRNSNTVEQSSEERNGWVYLFDGSSTEGWRAEHMESFPDSGWYISKNELVNDGSSKGNLLSKKQYGNFILEWEWRLFDEGGNSGVKYFVKETFGESSDNVLGLEYQMLDDERHEWMLAGKMKPNDFHTTGALYEFYPPSADKKMLPLGEFNKSKIVSDGDHVEHWLNGAKVVEYERGGKDFLAMKALSKFKNHPEFGLHDEGFIMLQDHSSRVGFKSIKIKVLSDKDSKK